MIRALLALLAMLAGPALALEFNLPSNARQTVVRNTAPDIYDAPVGVFANGQVPVVTVEGEVRRSAWRVSSPGLTPFQVMRPLREQLIEAGFEIMLDCRAKTCGGFDFRFATETLPGPNMYVNIRAFQFVTGMRKTGDTVTEVVTLFASTSATSAYVQIIHAGTLSEDTVVIETAAARPVSNGQAVQNDFASQLFQQGHAVLADLEFETGATTLGAGPFETLVQLAAFLKAQPQMRIVLVGHTDTTGGLQGNIAISRARAAAVRQRLIDAHGADPERMDAQGMGYLAPLASNLDVAGREKNRRVAVVLLGED